MSHSLRAPFCRGAFTLANSGEPQRRAGSLFLCPRMETNDQSPSAEERAAAALAEMERYCAEHPGSPAAIRRPRLFARGRRWVALYSKPLQTGVGAIGDTVRGALRAFDL